MIRNRALLHHSRAASSPSQSAEPAARGGLRVIAPTIVVALGAALFAQGLEPVSARSPSAPQRPAEPAPATLPADSEASAELFLKLQAGDTIAKLLQRSGVASAEADRAAELVAGALASPVPAGSQVAILLGDRSSLRRLTLRTGLELKLVVERGGNGDLRLAREDIAVDSTPLRFSGRSGEGAYWSLRSSGVPAELAQDYLAVVGTRLGPGDRFDLIVANRRASTGETSRGPLLYAAVDRASGRDLHMVNGSIGGRSGWFDASSGSGQAAELVRPVQGPVTSGFGTRIHPILRFARVHQGVDFAAAWGSPIIAAADGRVVGAGWNGGHGRQVRIAHSDGLETSYSHMSRIAAQPGSHVRRGQVIGYVGSTGFSTGPHLHYEIRDKGRIVDPSRVANVRQGSLSRKELEALRARLRMLLSTGTAKIAALPAATSSS